MRPSQSDRDRVASSLAAPPPWLGDDLFGTGGKTAIGAAARLGEHGAAGGVLVGAAVSVAVAGAPDKGGIEHPPKVPARVAELIDKRARSGPVRAAPQEPIVRH